MVRRSSSRFQGSTVSMRTGGVPMNDRARRRRGFSPPLVLRSPSPADDSRDTGSTLCAAMPYSTAATPSPTDEMVFCVSTTGEASSALLLSPSTSQARHRTQSFSSVPFAMVPPSTSPSSGSVTLSAVYGKAASRITAGSRSGGFGGGRIVSATSVGSKSVVAILPIAAVPSSAPMVTLPF
ncbi:hypothetical protein PIB30_071631 [Stylosanthes scabra]|uniref:Uncharacterized protein n=1 Tax=Stylosanthes scabra TaxID=79078 RepID=A0ABU6TR10_9FABA|nr:hypothetical protein [Stylosanthes scabra]